MRAKALVLACLAGALLLASGCGGDGGVETAETPPASPSPQASSTSQLTTYTNEEWGFALEYPADWSQGDPPAGLQLGDVDFATGFTSVGRLGELSEAEAEEATAAFVTGGRMPEELSDSDFRALLEENAAAMEEASGEMPTPGNPGIAFTRTEITALAGVPCLVADMNAEYEQGSVRHMRFYMLGKGDVFYTLVVYTTEDRWAQDKALLESIAQSFVIHD